MPRRRRKSNAVEFEPDESFLDEHGFGSDFMFMPFGPGVPRDWIYAQPEPPSSSRAPNSFGGRKRRRSSYGAQRARRARQYPEGYRRYRRFGNDSYYPPLNEAEISQSGYLSMWDGPPVVRPASWNPLQLQGGNIYQQRLGNPRLNQIRRY